MLARIDHTHLNSELPEFRNLVPTSENLLALVEAWLRQRWGQHFPRPGRSTRRAAPGGDVAQQLSGLGEGNPNAASQHSTLPDTSRGSRQTLTTEHRIDPLELLVHGIVQHLGEDPEWDGLRTTPYRVTKALRELTRGSEQDLERLVQSAIFDVTYDGVSIVKDIEVFSLCEHHMLPFYGKMYVAYIPRKKGIGLSKTARLVDIFARRLQIQNRLTQQVAVTIQESIDPEGLGVICEDQHLRMMILGVEKQHSSTITSDMTGVFHETPKTREEFLSQGSRGNGR